MDSGLPCTTTGGIDRNLVVFVLRLISAKGVLSNTIREFLVIFVDV